MGSTLAPGGGRVAPGAGRCAAATLYAGRTVYIEPRFTKLAILP